MIAVLLNPLVVILLIDRVISALQGQEIETESSSSSFCSASPSISLKPVEIESNREAR
jgi:hypothetical protein